MEEKQEVTVCAWLRCFMEEHAPWFWCIFSIVTVLIVYKAFSIAFLNKTPYQWDDMFQHTAISLLCILLMRETYQGEFHLGFRTRHFWQGVLLCWPAFLFIALNLVPNLCSGPVYGESLVMVLLQNASVGLFEEVVVRAILIGHMMHYWRSDPHRVFKSVLWSSVIFGVLHIGNIFSSPVSTVFQILYATGLGMVFAAAFIRTRNLWSCIAVHGLVDFFGSLSRLYVPLQTDPAAYQASLEQLSPLLLSQLPDEMAGPFTLLFYLCSQMFALLAVGVAIYLLRPGKRNQIEALWEKM